MRAVKVQPFGLGLGGLGCLLSWLAACGGSAASPPPLAPVPERATRATLVGPLCEGATCKCREDDGDAGVPDAGKKRFEIKLGPAEHELWATVDGMVLYKNREIATACYYLDLEPGRHPVRLRGAGEPEVAFEASVAERGGADDRTWWYSTFDFGCRGGCDRAGLNEFMQGLQGRQGKLDPCGSTKVLQPAWHTGRLPDHGAPTDLEIALELDVRKFVPEHPPGDARCAGGGREE